jgi:tetratricopeptide (TPR) repeat protein
MPLLVVKPLDVVEQLDWLTEHNAWPVIDELAAEHEATIKPNALMTYQLARSYRLRGDDQSAAEYSKKAFDMSDEPQMRFIIGGALLERNELEWFEQEYRAAISDERSSLAEILDAQIQLTSVKLDWLKYEECISLVDAAMQKAETDEELNKRFRESPWFSLLQSSRTIAESRIHARNGDRQKQRESLQTALKQEPQNIDVLIELYRLPDNSESLTNEIEKKIKVTTRNYQTAIDQESAAFRRQAFGGLRGDLAKNYNQYAWLVSNTFGDYDLALDYSKKSLELSPNSPDYLDTLARCYYAIGDYESAVIHQRKAAKSKPYLGQVQRQKDLFEKVYAEKTKEKSAANTTPKS